MEEQPAPEINQVVPLENPVSFVFLYFMLKYFSQQTQMQRTKMFKRIQIKTLKGKKF